MQPKKTNTADRELTVSRLLDAPIELVWEAWSNPEHIKNWWGPIGFRNSIHSMHFENGGEWNLTMHGPDGTDFKNKSIFQEIIPHRRIVYQHISAPHFVSTIEFEPQGDKTLLKWHMVFDTEEELMHVVKTFRADEGLKQNVVKLVDYLHSIMRV